MKLRLSLTALCLSLTVAPAFAAETCPWAGGEYSFKESGIYGDFSINSDCTTMVWSRLNEPETTVLERSKGGWKGRLTKVRVELLENGHNLRITGDGGVMRQTKATRKN